MSVFNKTRYVFDYNPDTYKWHVNLQEQAKSFNAKSGNGESWLFPLAMAKAIGEYYGVKNLFNGKR
jgi:hypothetical protein